MKLYLIHPLIIFIFYHEIRARRLVVFITFYFKQCKMSQNNSSHEPLPLLCFHQIHGPDLQLSNNNTTARKVTPGGSLLFSSHPLRAFQKFSLKISEIPHTSKEILSVGFTSYHPSESNQSIYSMKVTCLKKNKYIKNKTVYFYYTQTGLFHFGVEGQDKGCRHGRIQPSGPLWAFIYIAHPATTIEVLNCSPFDWSNLNLEATMLHQSRGRNVRLVKNVISKYDRRLSMSYAFTVNPVKIGEHVIIKILDVDVRSTAGLILGLTACNPSLLEKELPDNVALFLTRSHYWTIVHDPSWHLKLNDRISFVLTSDGRMRIWRNDSTFLKEIRVNVTTDLWAFFDISALESVEVSSYLSPNFENCEILPIKIEAVVEKKKPSDVEEDGLCVVCYENDIQAALYPCGHMCMCYGCAREQWRGIGHGTCPMCRVKIKDVLKIYKT